MAVIETLLGSGAQALIRRLIVEERKTHSEVSLELQRQYPAILRGLSKRSVRRFCDAHNIHSTSRINDADLDHSVTLCVARVSIAICSELL